MQDIWRLSAAELASLIKSKKVSAKEAAEAGLARLDAVNPKINAVVDHRPDDVLAQAAKIDAAIARGEGRSDTKTAPVADVQPVRLPCGRDGGEHACETVSSNCRGGPDDPGLVRHLCVLPCQRALGRASTRIGARAPTARRRARRLRTPRPSSR